MLRHMRAGFVHGACCVVTCVSAQTFWCAITNRSCRGLAWTLDMICCIASFLPPELTTTTDHHLSQLLPAAGCSTTCKRSLTSFGSCQSFDCRDPEAGKDTQAPQLYGVPVGYFEALESRVNITEGRGQDVSATDNYPCFDPTVTVSTERFATNPRTHR